MDSRCGGSGGSGGCGGGSGGGGGGGGEGGESGVGCVFGERKIANGHFFISCVGHRKLRIEERQGESKEISISLISLGEEGDNNVQHKHKPGKIRSSFSQFFELTLHSTKINK